MPTTRRILRHAFRCSAFVSLVAVVLVASAATGAAQAPRDRATFTRQMAEKLTAAIPGAQVEVKKEALTLGLKPPGNGAEFQVNLDRAWQFCSKNKDDCRAFMDDYVEKTAGAIARASAAPATAGVDVSTFRLLLRPAAYVNTLRQQLAKGPEGSEPVIGPFAGDLWWVLVTDDPQAVRVVTKGDLDQDKLGTKAAMEIGRANLEHLLPPLAKVAERPGATGVATIQGDFYTSSRLLLHDDDWDKLAQTFAGRMIAVAPDPRVVLYADFGVKGAYETMQRMAEDIAARSDRPLSMMVVQWTPDGWKPVAR